MARTTPTTSTTLPRASRRLDGERADVAHLFVRYEHSSDSLSRAEKYRLAAGICRELSLHAHTEHAAPRRARTPASARA